LIGLSNLTLHPVFLFPSIPFRCDSLFYRYPAASLASSAPSPPPQPIPDLHQARTLLLRSRRRRTCPLPDRVYPDLVYLLLQQRYRPAFPYSVSSRRHRSEGESSLSKGQSALFSPTLAARPRSLSSTAFDLTSSFRRSDRHLVLSVSSFGSLWRILLRLPFALPTFAPTASLERRGDGENGRCCRLCRSRQGSSDRGEGRRKRACRDKGDPAGRNLARRASSCIGLSKRDSQEALSSARLAACSTSPNSSPKSTISTLALAPLAHLRRSTSTLPIILPHLSHLPTRTSLLPPPPPPCLPSGHPTCTEQPSTTPQRHRAPCLSTASARTRSNTTKRRQEHSSPRVR
jgi:hypothetical protein